ncbi:unnamed protein product [Ectocarpus sp. CCAP 1310/34]|nr:unnamed protein product [Ectocarpus sp. CCAP 1310/34]
MVCNENKEEPVEHRWKWGIEEIAVVDQYTYLGVEIAKDCSWNAHMSKVAEKGKARAGKLHPILANRHLDTRIKLTVLKSVIVPPLEYAGEVWEEYKKEVKKLEAAQMKAAKIILGRSKRTRVEKATEWVKVVEDEWKGLDIDEEDETLQTEGLKGFQDVVYDINNVKNS